MTSPIKPATIDCGYTIEITVEAPTGIAISQHNAKDIVVGKRKIKNACPMSVDGSPIIPASKMRGIFRHSAAAYAALLTKENGDVLSAEDIARLASGGLKGFGAIRPTIKEMAEVRRANPIIDIFGASDPITIANRIGIGDLVSTDSVAYDKPIARLNPFDGQNATKAMHVFEDHNYEDDKFFKANVELQGAIDKLVGLIEDEKALDLKSNEIAAELLRETLVQASAFGVAASAVEAAKKALGAGSIKADVLEKLRGNNPQQIHEVRIASAGTFSGVIDVNDAMLRQSFGFWLQSIIHEFRNGFVKIGGGADQGQNLVVTLRGIRALNDGKRGTAEDFKIVIAKNGQEREFDADGIAQNALDIWANIADQTSFLLGGFDKAKKKAEEPANDQDATGDQAEAKVKKARKARAS